MATPAKAPQGLTQPTPEQVKGVIAELDQRWSTSTLKALERLDQAIDAGDGNQARYWSIVSGVGTDKILPLRGMPTQIVSNVHEHRHDMSGVMDKLASAARVLNTHRSKGYAQVLSNQPIKVISGQPIQPSLPVSKIHANPPNQTKSSPVE